MPRTSDPIPGRTRKALHQRELFERGRARARGAGWNGKLWQPSERGSVLLLRRGGCVERAEERTEDGDRRTLESEGVSVEVEEKGLELLRGVRTAEEGGGGGELVRLLESLGDSDSERTVTKETSRR